ncbi:hypothetical protein K4L04_08480 [Phaeobacter inhibens]|uniref:hypothetical protein n=1 Tax=Phaeobacter inhibens TaxID=221822 RepID=UPI0021A896F4|nr:hypothetical protein [Phaeobacter inhibens]UWR77957.1 hypothetical protein K4L04_08480 [Phaeobacter inhibens]
MFRRKRKCLHANPVASRNAAGTIAYHCSACGAQLYRLKPPAIVDGDKGEKSGPIAHNVRLDIAKDRLLAAERSQRAKAKADRKEITSELEFISAIAARLQQLMLDLSATDAMKIAAEVLAEHLEFGASHFGDPTYEWSKLGAEELAEEFAATYGEAASN